MNNPKRCARCHCTISRSYNSPMGPLCKQCREVIESLNAYYIVPNNHDSEYDDRKV